MTNIALLKYLFIDIIVFIFLWMYVLSFSLINLLYDFCSQLGKVKEINTLPLLSLRIHMKHRKHMKMLKAARRRYTTLNMFCSKLFVNLDIMLTIMSEVYKHILMI